MYTETVLAVHTSYEAINVISTEKLTRSAKKHHSKVYLTLQQYELDKMGISLFFSPLQFMN